ncbi:MAG: cadmium-translocating P-type ATPase [Campylobacteraceae bacterium]|jgi:Cd2+/Zn2+-exporting ATPase|nr:cadmium-translocating P-type ATPase [Campylobacteraceae bacterium]
MSESTKSCCSTCHHEHNGHFGKSVFFVGVTLYVIAMAFELFANLAPYLRFGLFFASYILIGGDVLKNALSNIKKPKNLFDEHFLMSIASLGAFAIGEYPEGVAVMTLYKIGEFLQERSVSKSRKSISALLDIKPQFANLKVGSKIIKTAPQSVKKGDTLIIGAGERVPLDGIVISGQSFLDMSALSGESEPKEVGAGSVILSGAINLSGLLSVRVTHTYASSTVSKIVKFVEEASAKKAQSEDFIRKFAKIYTPLVVACAALIAILPPLLFDGAHSGEWFYKALILLVISCPCALVISVPLSFFAGLGGASKYGILVKGGNFLEALSLADTVVFDKTGTLTKGKFALSEVVSAEGFTKEELLFYAALSESASPHPIARSIVTAYGKEISADDIARHEELFGFGVRASVVGKSVLAGNEKLMKKYDIAYQKAQSAANALYVAIDGVYAGYITISDEIKPQSLTLVRELGALGVKHIVMLTGDLEAIGRAVAKKLGIDEVYSELLPLEKVEKIELLARKTPKGKKVIFVGDGINDAPSLARADVGFAMGALGSDITAEAADIVLMNDNPANVVKAIKIAKKTTGIATQNIVLSLGVKALVLTLGIVGLSGMWAAIFADTGVAVLAALNAVRAFRV